MIKCAVLGCKKEGKHSFGIYSETLNKMCIVNLCEEHLEMQKKAGVNPKAK